MSTSLVVSDSLDISFDATIDHAGALQLAYGGVMLSDFDMFEVECNATEVVTFRLRRLQHADKVWSVLGDPRVSKSPTGGPLPGPWETDQVNGIMTEAVEVTVTASADGETPKTKKIHVKTKSRTNLPDPQMT